MKKLSKKYMSYPKPIKYLCHKYWRGNSHLFGWYYKQWFMINIGKPLNLKCYRYWKRKKNKKSRGKGNMYRTNNAKGKRNYLMQFQKHCGICGKEFTKDDFITLDHIIPKSKLKNRKLAEQKNNYQLAHYECNQLKADK